MDENNTTELGKEVIRQVAKPIQEFVSLLFGEPGKEIGLLLGDKIRGKRLENQINILNKAQKLVINSGLKPSAINIKLLVPLLDNASLDDNEGISEMWAHLLANAAISNSVRSSYVSILKDLEPVEAKIMNQIYQSIVAGGVELHNKSEDFIGFIDGVILMERLKLPKAEYEQSIDNLYRLRLLSPPTMGLTFVEPEGNRFALYTKKKLAVTYFGYSFVNACNQINTDNVK